MENNSGSNYSNVFNRLEKYDGKNSDFSSWLRSFDRACTIAQKNDDLVKGQIMMLCLNGQALAVAEQLEEEKKAQQPYTELIARLKSVFNTTASREAKMVEFENRVQRVDESEDEFMLSLVKLYKAANPDTADDAASLAIKRKFMNGISSELRRYTYIFCKEPYNAEVTDQNLLEAARKARLQLADQQLEQTSSLQVSSVSSNNNNSGDIMQAVNNLQRTFSERLDLLEGRMNNQHVEVYAVDDQYNAGSQVNGGGNFSYNNYNSNNNRGNQRFRGNDRQNNSSRGGHSFRGNNSSRGNRSLRGNRSFRGTRGFNNSNRGGNRNSPVVCYNCGGLNHYSNDCYSLN